MQTDSDQTLILPWGEMGDAETLQPPGAGGVPVPPAPSPTPPHLRALHLSPQT